MAKRTIDIQLSTKATGVKTAEGQIDALAKNIKSKMSASAASAKSSWTEFFFKWKILINGATAAWNTLRSAMDSSFKYETMTSNFRFLLRDVDTARSHMAELKKLGDSPPFSLDEFARASKQMLVMSDGVLGFSNSLKMVGDAAAATGVPIETMGHAVSRLYAFIRDGQPLGLATRELRNMGVLTPEVAAKLEDMRKAGASNIEIWEEVVKALGKFKGAQEEVGKTAEGTLSSIGTKLTNIWRQFTDGLMDKTVPALKEVNEQLKNMEDKGIAKKAGKAVGEAVSHPVDTVAQIHQATDPARAFLNLGKVMWGKVKDWWNRPMSKEELSAQRSIAEKKLQDAKGPYARLVAQKRLDRIDNALQTAPTTAQRELAETAKAAQVAATAASSGGNPFKRNTAAYAMFEKGLIDATGKATDKWYEQNGVAKPDKPNGPVAYWDKNGQATQAYKDLAASEKLKREEQERLEAAMKEKRAAKDLEIAAAAAKKQAEDAVKAERERIQRDITNASNVKSVATSRITAAQSEFDRAFAMYRDPAAAASQIAEERDYAADLKRLHRDANRYGGKWRIDELSRLMSAGDTQGMADTLEDWRKSKSFTPEVEAMVRASAAEQTKTTVEDELRKIETNTANLSAKLEELISMKGS